MGHFPWLCKITRGYISKYNHTTHLWVKQAFLFRVILWDTQIFWSLFFEVGDAAQNRLMLGMVGGSMVESGARWCHKFTTNFNPGLYNKPWFIN